MEMSNHPPHRPGDETELFHQRVKFIELERLGPVAEGFFGFVVDFDEERVGADGDRGFGKRRPRLAWGRF